MGQTHHHRYLWREITGAGANAARSAMAQDGSITFDAETVATDLCALLREIIDALGAYDVAVRQYGEAQIPAVNAIASKHVPAVFCLRKHDELSEIRERGELRGPGTLVDNRGAITVYRED